MRESTNGRNVVSVHEIVHIDESAHARSLGAITPRCPEYRSGGLDVYN
jgi:hypothetical protein